MSADNDIVNIVDGKFSGRSFIHLPAGDWVDLRAEIVRLRGEVEFHQLDAGALRVQLDSCIERLEVQTKNALHLHAMMVDAEARAEQAIAPAEAKDPAPAMPNGVEEMVAYLDNWLSREHGLNLGRVKVGDAVDAALRAADNRDDAGVCDCPGIGKADKALHAPNCPVRTAPAAVPTGKAVGGHYCDNCDGVAPETCFYNTTPPAPVQAAPQKGEAEWMRRLRYHMEHCVSAADEGVEYATPRAWLDAMTTLGLMEKVGRGRWAPTDAGQLFASNVSTHPSACELVVDDAMVERACLYHFPDWDMYGPAGKMVRSADIRRLLTAALQHRGDSQEVGRG